MNLVSMDIHYIFCVCAIKVLCLYFQHIWNTNQTLLTALVETTILPRTHYWLVFLLLVLLLSKCTHVYMESCHHRKAWMLASQWAGGAFNVKTWIIIYTYFFCKGTNFNHLIEILNFCQLTGKKQSYRKDHVLFSMVFSQIFDTWEILINTWYINGVVCFFPVLSPIPSFSSQIQIAYKAVC